MKLAVLSFYKYITIRNPKKFRDKHQAYCNGLGIKGKVLLSKEGINGTVSGTGKQIKLYETELIKNKIFSNIKFNKTTSSFHPFKKMIVRVRKEIVTSGIKVDIRKIGKYLSPEKLQKMYEDKEDFVIVDARNDYEHKIGKFKYAVTARIETFRDFKMIVPNLSKYKNKKLVMYCTGGVRCEKASSYLIKKGFKNVYQLERGILNYIRKFPDSYFYGRCFVFDDRLSLPSGKKNKAISFCEKCHKPSGRYINCANKYCDKLFICCEECDEKFKYSCSKTCAVKVSTEGRKSIK